ncbi:ArsO family NAD(P)H-dependent flavin-containing monooxygenase [Haloactinomyces albus]|uniref:Flavoprotein involved in K+ transport n=1 Tax=Haloactinomyces albus TaxID=1352928 RepID=A0AAE3ZHC4_9ACTN|nr:ArsO family NAD(P)H-dependent flavin-containing monooxygenase [Haloactinomyces albus]MDR7304035.1 putative flavoprotein involved in K+ transport [Haloactinomyces albus]
MAQVRDVVVIGGGQAGLAAGYFLRRAGLDFVLLDAAAGPGGAWRHMWPSLRLFSPAEHSPLPGWPMPRQTGAEYPTVDHVVNYLTRYEQRYALPVHRPVRVTGVHDGGEYLAVHTDRGTWQARVVISATGTWQAPYVPSDPGQEEFTGRLLHTASYRGPEQFRGQRVVVVGGGNSAAQILAEVSTVAETTWVTRRPPRFMPDDVDGRVLFDVATRRHRARQSGSDDTDGVADLGDIVLVPSVLDARRRGVLRAEPMFDCLTRNGVTWSDGTEHAAEAVIWCTGFRPGLQHLRTLGLRRQGGIIPTDGTRAIEQPRLHLLGYGDWTGPASATLIGAGRTAKAAVSDIAEWLAARGETAA